MRCKTGGRRIRAHSLLRDLLFCDPHVIERCPLSRYVQYVSVEPLRELLYSTVLMIADRRSASPEQSFSMHLITSRSACTVPMTRPRFVLHHRPESPPWTRLLASQLQPQQCDCAAV